MKSNQLALLISAILGAAASVAAPQSFAASDDQSKKPTIELEEVVVTATKYQADITEKPVSVSEFNAEQRNLANIATAESMLALTPGVTLTGYGVAIRGIGRGTLTTSLGSADPVAYYVNGFYMPAYTVIGENTLIGGNVQILRGPQGFRYGTNAIGGAASLISRVPTDTFKAESLLGYGRYNWHTEGFTISGPLSDNYRVRFSVQDIGQSDSSQKNHGGVDAGYKGHNLYAEFQLDGNVTDDLHFLLRSSTYGFTYRPAPTASLAYTSTNTFQGGSIPNVFYHYTRTPPTTPREIDIDFPGIDKLHDNQVHILNTDWKLGPVTLYYVGGYQRYISEGNSDYDNSPRIGFTTGPTEPSPGTFISTSITANYYQINTRSSHELRLEGNVNEVLEWNVGAYYSKGHYDQSYWIANPNQPQLANPVYRYYNGAVQAGAPIQPNPLRATYTQHNILYQESTAGFGQATYHFTDALSLTGGLRYTKDDTSGHSDFHQFYWDTFFAGDVTPLVHGASPTANSHGVTGTLAADYKLTDETNVYFSYGRGYKPGSMSLDNILPNSTGTNNVSASEHLNAYEFGIKQQTGTTLFSTLALFYNDYRDLQIPATVYSQSPNPGGGLTSIPSLFYFNADAKIYGAELESTWTPTSQVWVRANYTYTYGKYTDFGALVVDPAFPTRPGPTPGTTENNGVSAEGNRLARTPLHKASLAGYYSFNFVPGSLIVGGYVYYNGSMYSTFFDTPTYKIKDYTTVSAALTWRAADNKYEVSATSSNLLNRDYVTGIAISGTDLNIARQNFYGAARFYSLQLRMRFQ